MKSRIILVVLPLAIAVAAVATAVARWGSAQCPVDVRPETFEKLKLDMSEQEIEAILGGPAGDYTTGPGVHYYIDGGICRSPEQVDRVTTKEWLTDQYAIYVHFDPEGKAVVIGGAPCFAPVPSMRYPSPLRQILHPFVDP